MVSKIQLQNKGGRNLWNNTMQDDVVLWKEWCHISRFYQNNTFLMIILTVLLSIYVCVCIFATNGLRPCRIHISHWRNFKTQCVWDAIIDKICKYIYIFLHINRFLCTSLALNINSRLSAHVCNFQVFIILVDSTIMHIYIMLHGDVNPSLGNEEHLN